MEIKSYNQMQVSMLKATTNPQQLIALALRMTMRKTLDMPKDGISAELGKYLITADHTSPLEHVSFTFLISGVSRSFLAQITRHRMGSFTSASQHYQKYDDYPCIIQDIEDQVTHASLLQSYVNYHKLLELGKPVWEARQVLPNAAAVNILWSINARAMINFLRQRLCMRNVGEMQVFAGRVQNLVSAHLPEVFNHVGPQCYEDTCKQGKMKCKSGPWRKWGTNETLD